MNTPNRNKETLLLAIVSVLLITMSFVYFRNIGKDLDHAQHSYKGDSASVVNLSASLDTDVLQKILSKGNYFPDPAYTQFAVQQLQSKLAEHKTLPNLGALNKRDFQVDAETMEKEGGSWGKERVKASQIMMGLDSLTLAEEMKQPQNYPSIQKISNNNTGISFHGKIITAKDKKKGIESSPAKGVLIKLTEEYTSSHKDSIQNKIIADVSVDSLKSINLNQLVQSPEFFARTDANGNYTFTNLEEGKNYSIIPIKRYKDYGDYQGASLVGKERKLWFFPKKEYEFNFTEKPHKLKIFDNVAYQKIKTDESFTVRTPDTYKKDYLKYFTLFILGFWFFHLALRFKKATGDQIILPILLFLSGTGLVVLYSIQEPLSGEIYGGTLALYVFFVMFLLSAITLFVSPQKIHSVLRWNWVQNFRRNGGNIPKLLHPFTNPNQLKSNGYLWLMLSIVLMILLLLFGSGPEGSGVKVNLGPIQVSEVSKFLMILFFAKYFTANIEYFRRIPNNQWLIKHNFKMFLFFIFLIGIYGVLGDLGPALVLSLTFLVFYSFAKNEFLPMVISGLVYAVVIYIASIFFTGEKYIMATLSIIICLLLGIYTFFVRRKDESSFFLVFLISAFIFLEIIPISQFQRLADRNSMFRDIWDNDLNGGDQIAQGVWSLASGGYTGQGLGNGFSNVMPAYHTDMIFQSIGEELGFFALISLLFGFLILFFRVMKSAKKTANPFLFYLFGGIGVATMLQLTIIIGGSLGLIPLTGISVPFLSKGNSSLMINLFFFGILILLSQLKGSEKEKAYTQSTFDGVNGASVFAFAGVILLFALRLIWFQWNADENMIRPAFVLSKQGGYQMSENPRIKIISRALMAGNIYDRNGKLLATSDKKLFADTENEVSAMNPNLVDQFQKQKLSNLKRYYPYSEDLVFWLGDMNNQLVSSQTLGYVAEFSHLSELRDLENKTKNEKLQPTDKVSNHYRESPFLPVENSIAHFFTNDYSAYIPYLKAGIRSNKIQEFNKNITKRSITLSLDVQMNETINNLVQTEEYKGYKASVVAIKVDDGQVLASAINPKPNYQDLRKISEFGKINYNKLMKVYFRNSKYENYVADRDFGITWPSLPGSSSKVITGTAFMRRYGTDSTTIRYDIIPEEKIFPKEPTGSLDMREAIKNSSNVFFIKLTNEHNLHPELFDLYQSVGIQLDHFGGYFYNKPNNYNAEFVKQNWSTLIAKNKENYTNPKFIGTKKRFSSFYSAISYGQFPMEATPLQMARFYGAVANKGILSSLHFTKDTQTKDAKTTGFQISKNEASNAIMESYLETEKHSVSLSNKTKIKVYGKTGSAVRYQFLSKKGKAFKTIKFPDSWYIFYIKDTKFNAPIAFAVRIQGIGMSDRAVALSEKIINSLKDKGYFTTTK